MQHGRGDVLDRHALPGGDRIDEAQGKAAGLRLRYRRRRPGDCPQWPISGVDPEGRLGGAPRSFLREELTALNSQLTETIEHQRATANDLRNTMNSSEIAMLFL